VNDHILRHLFTDLFGDAVGSEQVWLLTRLIDALFEDLNRIGKQQTNGEATFPLKNLIGKPKAWPRGKQAN
jgi:hypothetical protein